MDPRPPFSVKSAATVKLWAVEEQEEIHLSQEGEGNLCKHIYCMFKTQISICLHMQVI